MKIAGSAQKKTGLVGLVETRVFFVRPQQDSKNYLPATGNTHPPCLEPHKI